MLVDSHCHLDQIDLAEVSSIQNMLQLAKNQGIAYFLCVAIDLQNSRTVVEIAEQFPEVMATIGLHPNEMVTQEPTIEFLQSLATHPKVIAVGETGLDYYRGKQAELEWQRERFRLFIELGKRVKKPLIIHCREAAADTLAILRQEQAQDVGGVFHCFTDTLETAKAAVELGFYISFSGIVTFQNAKALQDIVRQLPLDRILIETDAPYLAPTPYRGKQNQPAYVKYVAQKIAELTALSYEQIAAITTDNFFRAFPLSAAYR
jgi:TatD DNase family protein